MMFALDPRPAGGAAGGTGADSADGAGADSAEKGWRLPSAVGEGCCEGAWLASVMSSSM